MESEAILVSPPKTQPGPFSPDLVPLKRLETNAGLITTTLSVTEQNRGNGNTTTVASEESKRQSPKK